MNSVAPGAEMTANIGVLEHVLTKQFPIGPHPDRRAGVTGLEMDDVQEKKSLAARLAWPLLVLTGVLQVYLGLSAVAYLFLGVPGVAHGPSGWVAAAMGALQTAAAVVAFVFAARGALRGATLAVAGSLMLGWLSSLPGALEQGIDFRAGDWGTLVLLAVSPFVAVAAAALAWRGSHPIAAAFVASSMTIVGLFFVIAFAVVIAISGF
jgi:hypothetical protein